MNQFSEAKKILEATISNSTELDESSVKKMVEQIPLKAFKKGSVLLNQGSEPNISYYVLKGCVRQYKSDENGKEATIDFFLENDAINMLSYSDDDGTSMYSLSCLEDSILVVCPHFEVDNIEDEKPEISKMIQGIFAKQFTELQSNFADFKIQSPEERFLTLKRKRPDLMQRIPQHVLASYLNITPETYSRFKKRL